MKSYMISVYYSVLFISTISTGNRLRSSKCCLVEGLTVQEIASKFGGSLAGQSSGSGGDSWTGSSGSSDEGQAGSQGFPVDYQGSGWGGWYKSVVYRGGSHFNSGSIQGEQRGHYGQETKVKYTERRQFGSNNKGEGFGGGQSRGSKGRVTVVCCQSDRDKNPGPNLSFGK